MPAHKAPRNAGIHRIAGIGLFRALLNQCRNVPLDSTCKLSLANIVRQRFRALSYEQSQWRLKRAWEAGYTGLSLMDNSANGDAISTEKLSALLSQAPSRLKHSPKAPNTDAAQRRPLRKKDPQDSILARPRPMVSGKRRIPVLTFGNRIPFLRIKKPQPHALGALLRKRERVQISRTIRVHEYEQMNHTGALEDQWDKLLLQHGIRSTQGTIGTETSWREPYIVATRLINQAQESWRQKRNMHGMKLMRIVEEEKKLAAKEKAQRRRNYWQGQTDGEATRPP